MSRMYLTVLVLLPLVVLGSAARGEEPNKQDAEKLAVDAAQAWLAIIDQGKYDDGWQQTATYFRNVVSKESFAKSLTGVRQPLGMLSSRKLKSQEYRTSLPGAPDGQYVIIQFDSSFADKKEAVETCTPMLDKDGTWRVSGYFIK